MSREPKPAPAFPGALEHIVVSRHGDRADGDFITERSQNHFVALAKKFVSEGALAHGTTGAVCSTKLRTLKSLQAFMRGLAPGDVMWPDNPVEDRGLESREELLSSDMSCDVDAAFAVICEHADLKALVVFTHMELAEALPVRICDRLGISIVMSTPRCGDAVHIDVLRKKATYIES
jgi:hypothetical protein